MRSAADFLEGPQLFFAILKLSSKPDLFFSDPLSDFIFFDFFPCMLCHDKDQWFWQ